MPLADCSSAATTASARHSKVRVSLQIERSIICWCLYAQQKIKVEILKKHFVIKVRSPEMEFFVGWRVDRTTIAPK